MTLAQRYEGILGWFETNMPSPETELNYRDPYELLVAVILSAQCTDKRVNLITPPLFDEYPTPHHLAQASKEEIFELIKSISYPNNKTRSLMGMARKLVDDFHGIVPDTMEELLTIPGVGRKTANVMLSVVFKKPAMAVDTHVFRVSERLGLTSDSHSTLETERILTEHIPPNLLGQAHHWLILHGRYVCKARRPECLDCGLKPWCHYFSKA